MMQDDLDIRDEEELDAPLADEDTEDEEEDMDAPLVVDEEEETL